jgi:hypothetical protein
LDAAVNVGCAQLASHFRSVAKQAVLQLLISSLLIAMRFPLINIVEKVATAKLWSNFLFIMIFLFVGFIVFSEFSSPILTGADVYNVE